MAGIKRNWFSIGKSPVPGLEIYFRQDILKLDSLLESNPPNPPSRRGANALSKLLI